MKRRKASSSKDVEMSYIPVSLEIDVQHGEKCNGFIKAIHSMTMKRI
jgi:hypothetical protein